jgi:hypothetical protein
VLVDVDCVVFVDDIVPLVDKLPDAFIVNCPAEPIADVFELTTPAE